MIIRFERLTCDQVARFLEAFRADDYKVAIPILIQSGALELSAGCEGCIRFDELKAKTEKAIANGKLQAV